MSWRVMVFLHCPLEFARGELLEALKQYRVITSRSHSIVHTLDPDWDFCLTVFDPA
ncbi:hypothetical protein ES703_49672 [subsurface metagenome]